MNGHIEGEHGYGFEVEKSFEDVHPDDYDLLLIPRGRQMESLQWFGKTQELKLSQNRFLHPINPFPLFVMVLGF